MVIVALLRVYINIYAFCRTHLCNTLFRVHASPLNFRIHSSMKLAAHSTFTIEPPSRIDRLAVILAVKAATQGGQQHRRPDRYRPRCATQW